ncbi:MAG: hypothetical protein SF162_19705 [bacterium]|nr:hypothetical protein [bacterium]
MRKIHEYRPKMMKMLPARFACAVMRLALALLIACLAACAATPAPTEFPTIPAPPIAITPVPTFPPPPTETPFTPLPFPPEMTDASAVMSGLCFESVHDATGRPFVIRSADELTALYDLADNSRLCRRPVRRETFDFADGRVLAGVWSRGYGCTARHDVIRIDRDDTARRYAIELDLVVEGTCPYELVRPFWVGIDGVSDYEIGLYVL